MGLILWLALQGYLLLIPLFGRATLPEPDDSVPYALRAHRLAQCPFSDCPALQDLAAQFAPPTQDPEVLLYRQWAGTAFGSQNPLFSLLLLAMGLAGLDPLAAYRCLYLVAPAVFGAGFAYLLAVSWGVPAAGVALLFLAFKVFPDTGLNFLVPSNLAMGLSAFVLARVMARRGRAPWSLSVGCLALIGLHPVGIILTALCLGVALSLSGFRPTWRIWAPALPVLLLALAAGIWLPPDVYNISHFFRRFDAGALLAGGALSLAAVAVELSRLKDILFGPLHLFFAAVVWGFCCAPGPRRALCARVLGILGLFLAASLFAPRRSPADVFFRLWIPAVVMLYGAVGYGTCCCLRLTRELLRERKGRPAPPAGPEIRRHWPVALLAVLLGYWLQMAFSGASHILVTAEHFKKRLPLAVCDSQPRSLLDEARPGDRVLYLSALVMPHFFLRGALGLGAVYYHPVLGRTETARQWLSRPDVRFAVAYNPLVHHPALEDLHERRWGVSSPSAHSSPWSDPRVYGSVLEEDAVPMASYKWVEIEPRGDAFPRTLRLWVSNGGSTCRLRLIPVAQDGEPLIHEEVVREIPGARQEPMRDEYESAPDVRGRTLGRGPAVLPVDLEIHRFAGRAKRLRIVFSGWKTPVRLHGAAFDGSNLRWPWEHRAALILMHRKWEVATLWYSFDPAGLLPPPLNARAVRVMDDCGSSVLLRIDR
jgi:hypothetical protein